MRHHRQRHFVFSDGNDGHVRDLLFFRRNSLNRLREYQGTVIVIRCYAVARFFIGLTHEGELRVQPGEFAIAQTRMQRDFIARVFRNRDSVVHSVGRARRDKPHIHYRPCGPGVALIDGVTMRIDLQGAIEVGAFFHRPLAIALYHATPENSLPFFIRALQFKPRVVSIDRAAGEKVSHLLGADDDIHPHCIAASQGRLYAIQRSGDGRNFSARARSDFGFRLFADRKGCGQLRLTGGARLQRRLRRRYSKDVDRERAALQEFFGEF